MVLAGAAAAVIYAGLYNIAADVPHTQPIYWLFETVRDRSVATRARDIVVPKDLDDPNRISKGAGQYAEMCSGCHLAPGMKRTARGAARITTDAEWEALKAARRNLSPAEAVQEVVLLQKRSVGVSGQYVPVAWAGSQALDGSPAMPVSQRAT